MYNIQDVFNVDFGETSLCFLVIYVNKNVFFMNMRTKASIVALFFCIVYSLVSREDGV